MRVMIERCCGLDVHQEAVVACFLISVPSVRPTKGGANLPYDDAEVESVTHQCRRHAAAQRGANSSAPTEPDGAAVMVWCRISYFSLSVLTSVERNERAGSITHSCLSGRTTLRGPSRSRRHSAGASGHCRRHDIEDQRHMWPSWQSPGDVRRSAPIGTASDRTGSAGSVGSSNSSGRSRPAVRRIVAPRSGRSKYVCSCKKLGGEIQVNSAWTPWCTSWHHEQPMPEPDEYAQQVIRETAYFGAP
jgi:hypothetical protein